MSEKESRQRDNQQEPHAQRDVDEIMALAMEHYLVHHQVVLKKLQHAQTATRQSFQEIERMPDQKRQTARTEIEKYDAFWKKTIDMFKSSGIAEEGLQQIEKVLTTIPRIIKKFYDALVRADAELLDLMRQIASDKYKKAYSVIYKLQSKPDMMSGLGPEEFEPDHKIKTASMYSSVIV